MYVIIGILMSQLKPFSFEKVDSLVTVPRSMSKMSSNLICYSY